MTSVHDHKVTCMHTVGFPMQRMQSVLATVAWVIMWILEIHFINYQLKYSLKNIKIYDIK
jgi:hypothetical protein